MDTGLGRDSLSIISQGNISSFADARPEERRLLFEEAAGVAKYKKRKKISLAKLENVKANLERVQDQVDSCASQMKTLERQAEKAEQYLACKKELADIEISLLAMQIEENKEKELEQKAALERMQTRQNEQNRISMEADQQMEALQEEIRHTDARLVNLQNELARVMEESVSLNKQKAILDERRKISLSSADKQARAQSLLELFSEAKYEYEDRRRRLAAMKLDTQTRESHQQKALGESRRLVEESRRIENEIHSLQNQLAGVESRLAHPPYRNHGVQAVMHNASRLSGICGLVQDLLECDDEYMNAISVALGSANEQIVVESDSDARRAIGWLKRSGAGRATFLPLSVCKGRYLQDWQRSIAIKQHGILGEASRFVRCKPRYEALRDRLLGNILIASSLEEANQAARALRQSVKIVTLGGDVVHAGGAMTGGSLRPNVNPIPALKKEKERLLDEIAARREALGDLQREFDQAQAQTSQMGSELLQMKIEQEKLASIVQVKRKNTNRSRDRSPSSISIRFWMKKPARMRRPNLLNAFRPFTRSPMSSTRRFAWTRKENRSARTERQSQRNAAKRQTRADESDGKTSKVQSELARIQTRLEQDLLRLGSDYSLTFEAAKAKMQPIEVVSARAQVKKLRSQIVALGSVNLEAPEQLKEVRERYEFLTSQMEELISASEQILGAVDEMDQTMITQFKDMFDRINGCLDEVFQSMFGGGRCRLVLCEPDNLLESGVDVDVQPLENPSRICRRSPAGKRR
ncbi:chromosome segregation protein SMC [Allobaculum sp. Allo2]|uniref:chromosome segregation protein SMC n=1 Tax=Allobaculum sp. Allo2 TaxID=2853432 RepID=UPI001F61C811|nr:chromosome segregation protein SMC [Allobaculum sp. Allo2]UNT94216.1 chromosome segregation protein SMC [Allobaculum sp. Allo2]